MHRILLILIFQFPFMAFGQALQMEFNRAILINSDSGNVVVPAGKAWKVVSIFDETVPYRSSVSVSYPRGNASTPDACNGCNDASCNNREMRSYSWSDCSSKDAPVYANGKEISIENIQSTSLLRLKSPFWLKAGDSLKVGHTPPCYSIPVTSQPSGSCWNCGTIFLDNLPGCTPDVRQCGTQSMPGYIVRVSRWVNILEFDLLQNPTRSLKFHQVHTFDATTGQQSVPQGKMWRITKSLAHVNQYVLQSQTNQSVAATPSNPNPCTGDTTGNYTRWTLQMNSCCNGEVIELNGKEMRYRENSVFEDYNIWLPEGTTIESKGSNCAHSTSLSIPAQGVYFFQNNNQLRCGPAQFSGSTQYSPLLSILEFEVQ